MKSFFKSLFLNNRLFIVIGVEITLLVLSFFFSSLYPIAKIILIALFVFIVIDCIILFSNKSGFFARRQTMEKFSNGDLNIITIQIENRYVFAVDVTVIDEIPFQFQLRDQEFTTHIKPGKEKHIQYALRPVERGEYHFGSVNIYVSSAIGLIKKRYTFSGDMMIPVYPSFIQMRKYELMAISNTLSMAGIKKIRRIGNNAEFEQIKEYVTGDDYRIINWKATARKSKLMVNQFQEEKSQQVYCLIDMGRLMKMPFNHMSLLDYAINSSLAISNIALKKDDKAGIITFSKTIHKILPAEKKGTQIKKILELLYNQKTNFLESNFDTLYSFIKAKIPNRSLLILYTNFESLQGMKRQLKYISLLAKSHLVIVVFFENTELNALINKQNKNLEEIYTGVIAEKFAFEKRLIVKELERLGIQSILTSPENLSINTINKYLELKARGLF